MSKAEARKDAALEALLSSGTLSEAAEKAGVDRRTMYNYLHSDHTFASAYQEARNRMAVEKLDGLREAYRQAVAVLAELMGEGQKPEIRLKAAQAVLAEVEIQSSAVSKVAQSEVDATNPNPWYQ